jgi:7,8-dihydroneopterin aldolase/epimerase/oxygenase
MNNNETRVFIRNLEVLARIGVHGHEQGKPQPVRITVSLTAAVKAETDRLENAVDYETIAGNIRSIIASGHINLAETLAERIAASCLLDPRVTKCRVSVEKLQALPGAEAAGVEIERSRES